MKKTKKIFLALTSAASLLFFGKAVEVGAVSANYDGPVMRLFYPPTGEHFYTMDQNEKSILTKTRGWRYEGEIGASYYSTIIRDGSTPVHRLYNQISRNHLYTMDSNEINVLTKKDWIDEGIAFYSVSKSSVPVTDYPYRMYNPRSGEHFYTGALNEVSVLESRGWRNEGVGFYFFSHNRDEYDRGEEIFE
jgi:hypothetical protein